MKLKIAVLPGDGVGPEVTGAAVRVLRAIANVNGYEFKFTEADMGGVAIRNHGRPLPENTLQACLDADAVFLGAVGHPEFDGMPRDKKPETGLLALRQALGGFANLRPVQSYPALVDASPIKQEVVFGSDVLIVRELLGGLYFGEPRGVKDDTATNTMSYSRYEVERVAHVAFQQARSRRKKLTSVDKANVLECSQLWRQVVSEVGKHYPDVKLEHAYVDSFAMRLIQAPAAFDVVLTENLFGDILSDEAAVIGGSLGLLASATIGGEVDLYEPVHGSAPDIAGKGIANPIGAINSAAMLLRHTAKLEQDARLVEAAVNAVLLDGYRTKDLVGSSRKFNTTAEISAAIERQCSDMAISHYAYHAV
ncbi:MAG TPA: 3-isopropylmalate dehydrogenase [Candidatus Koribacter sp.]|jgi:3-isopropylmalate dehydrogenase